MTNNTGRVLSILSGSYSVQCEDLILECTLKGALKKNPSKQKNLVVVGDIVEVDREKKVIISVFPRRTLLSRQENLHRRKEQLIAANIDRVLITSSFYEPRYKSHLIDRYLIASAKGKCEGVLVMNKVDLAPREEVDDFLKVYKSLDIKVVCTSCETGEGIDSLLKIMEGRACLFAGQSGVGKSSLINTVTGLNLHTQQVSGKNEKGRHTTSRSLLIPLKQGGWCIDSPGIRSFGVWDLTFEDLQTYFIECSERRVMCRFQNCTHTHEPGCAVLKALEEGKISPMRYDSYCKLLEESSLNKRRI